MMDVARARPLRLLIVSQYYWPEDFRCAPDNPAALAATVAGLAARSVEERDAMGRQGRDYYHYHFDRDRLLDQLESWLQNLRVPASR
jgi:hypothetical protein